MFHEFVGLIRIDNIRVISLPCLNRIYPHIKLRKCTIIKRRSIKKLSDTGKQLCWSLFFNKNADIQTATLLKTDSTQMFS